MVDLRHIRDEYGEPDFPTNQAVDVSLRSLPYAATARAGTHLVLAIGGDGRELHLVPETVQPTIAITTGGGSPGTLRLPLASPR